MTDSPEPMSKILFETGGPNGARPGWFCPWLDTTLFLSEAPGEGWHRFFVTDNKIRLPGRIFNLIVLAVIKKQFAPALKFYTKIWTMKQIDETKPRPSKSSLIPILQTDICNELAHNGHNTLMEEMSAALKKGKRPHKWKIHFKIHPHIHPSVPSKFWLFYNTDL